MVCTTPKLRAGRLSVTFSNDGFDFTDVIRVDVDNGWNANLIRPSLGGLNGGTKVMIIGSHFDAGQMLRCKFDFLYVVATVESASKVSCISPASNPGEVAVQIVNAHMESSLNKQMKFIFTEEIQLLGVAPPRGPVRGGSTLQVSGLNFLSSGMTISFSNEILVGTKFLTSTLLQCTTPSMKVPLFRMRSLAAVPAKARGALRVCEARVLRVS